jgi:hypothetical protein
VEGEELGSNILHPKQPNAERVLRNRDCPKSLVEVRFTPESGQIADISVCPLCARSDQMHRSKTKLIRSPRRRGQVD